jgi:hypothetical protein
MNLKHYKMKKCSKCHIEQDFCFFGKDNKMKDGLKLYCKNCRKQEGKIYRDKYSDKISEYHKKNYVDNRNEILKRNSLWLSQNKEKKKEIDKKYREEKSELITKNRIKFLKKNPNYINEYNKEKKQTNPIFKMSSNVRVRIYRFLKKNNINKNNKTFQIIGCSPNQLKEHLEKKFVNGMTWENQGEWHIDHIIPLSSAKSIEEIIKLCHYSNLQPLWAKDNLKKGYKIL